MKYKINNILVETIIAISLLAVLTLAISAATTMPIVYWNLDETSGITANDSSGNNNIGNVSKGVWTAGKINNSLSLNGTEDNYIIRKSLSGFPTSEITVEFWMKTADNINSGTPFSYASSATDNDFRIYDYNNFEIDRGSSSVETGISANDGVWHHIAVTWRSSDGNVKLYKDGINVYTGIMAREKSITQGGSLVIGQDQDRIGGGFERHQSFKGLIDEIKVYDRILSDFEIFEEYQRANPPTPTVTPKPTVTPTPTVTPKSTVTPTNYTYYVSATGSDDNFGTQSLPFKTIQKGIYEATNGDSIKVLPGTYYLTDITGFINIDKSVNVTGSGRSNTIIDGSQITNYDATDENQGLVKINADGVYFGGFTVQNALTTNGSSGARGIIIKSNNNTIEKNLIQHTFQSGIALWGHWSGSTKVRNNTIRYNELYDISKGNNTICGSGIHVNEALSVVQADSFEIYYNYVHRAGYSQAGGNTMCGAEGIDIYQKSLNGKVHHNYIDNTRSVGLYFDEAQNVEAWQNIVENTYGWNGPSERGNNIALSTERGGTDSEIWLHDNIANNSDRGLWICLESPSSGVIKDDTIGSSNIFYNNGNDIHVKSCGATMSNIRIINNYVSKISINDAVSNSVFLYGNIMGPTNIANKFNTSYAPLKTDILNNVNRK